VARISNPTSQPTDQPFAIPDDDVATPVSVRGGTAGVDSSGPFLKQVRDELRRVTWPDRDHLTQATIVVLIVVVVSAAYLASLDALFNELIGWIL